MTMTPKMRQQLKAKAHGLNPIVMIGSDGLKDSVINELNRALNDHELIKVKFLGHEKSDRLGLSDEIVNRLSAVLVQMIGKVAIFYRKNEEDQL